jgi:hypothetical protein
MSTWRYYYLRPLCSALLGSVAGISVAFFGWAWTLDSASDLIWVGTVGFFVSLVSPLIFLGAVAVRSVKTAAVGFLGGVVAGSAFVLVFREPSLETGWRAEADRPAV